MDGLLGVAGMIITSDYGSFLHSLRLAPVRKLHPLNFTEPFFGGFFPMMCGNQLPGKTPVCELRAILLGSQLRDQFFDLRVR